MQIDNIITKVKELREDHHRDINQGILTDLIELRKVLVAEIEEGEKTPANGTAPSDQLDKANYRIAHLASSYKALLEQSEIEKTELKNEINKLNYRINILKQNVKIE